MKNTNKENHVDAVKLLPVRYTLTYYSYYGARVIRIQKYTYLKILKYKLIIRKNQRSIFSIQ